MENYIQIASYVIGFLVVAIASNHIAKLFQLIRLPLITGLLAVGILCGPFVLEFIPKAAISGNLDFLNNLSLAFIAFAAGSELYLKDLRSRYRSIAWITFGQLVITFVLGSLAVYMLSEYIPFMQEMNAWTGAAIAMLAGTIFVARSPASAIAVISEMRAKGPFTQTSIGVTVVKDVLVIILFAVCFAFAEGVITGVDLSFGFVLILLLELSASFALGYLLGRLLNLLLSLPISKIYKTILLLTSGFSIYLLSHFLRSWGGSQLNHEIYLEPLLICIIGSFVVTNYSKYRAEFLRIIHDTGPFIYVIFFTLTGASLSITILEQVWEIALLLFGVRILAMIIGGLVGGYMGGDPWRFNMIGWTPFVTQAGVGLGLATVIAHEFPDWGPEFATIIIAVIVMNQIVGPPLFKWAINFVGESHLRAQNPGGDTTRDAIIFGLEGQSVALARKLKEHHWKVKIATRDENSDLKDAKDLDIQVIPDLSVNSMNAVKADQAEAIVTMLDDDENYQLCEQAYEQFGTKDLVVRLNDRENFNRFHKLNALIVEPSTAIVSLMDHLVRSPQATSLLLGMEEDQDTVDLEIRNDNMHGLALRDLRLPPDVIILSVKRDGQVIISHGYTRLRKNDIVTLVGSIDSLEKVRLRFE